jgi:hypothetical protein
MIVSLVIVLPAAFYTLFAYRDVVLGLRRGVHRQPDEASPWAFRPLQPKEWSTQNVPYFIGRHVSCIAFGFLIWLLVLFVSFFLLGSTNFWNFVWWQPIRQWWMALVGSSIVRVIVKGIAAKLMMDPAQHHLTHPRLFSLYSLFLHIFSMFIGVSSALMRFVYLCCWAFLAALFFETHSAERH